MPTINVNNAGTVEKVPFGIYKTGPTDPYWGRGIDGNATIGSSKNINTQILGTASGSPARAVDAPATAVTAISGAQLTVASSANFRENDYVIVMNMLGNGTEYNQVGTWELARIAIGGVINSTTINLVTALTKIYGQSGPVPGNAPSDLATQKVMIQRVPEYATVSGSSSINCSGWNGTTGGVVAFMCWDLNLTGPAGVDVTNLGYRNATAFSQGSGSYGIGFGEGVRGLDSSPSNNNGKQGATGVGTGATNGGPSNGTASGGGGGAGGAGGGGIGGNRLAGPQGAGGGGGGGGGSGAAGGGNGSNGANATGSTGAIGNAAGSPNAPTGGAGGVGQPGGAGGAITPGPDDIESNYIYMGGGGGGHGDLGGNGSGGGNPGSGASGSNGASGPQLFGAGNGGGIVIIWAKQVTACTVVMNGGSVAMQACTQDSNTNNTIGQGGAGGAAGARTIGAGGAGSALIITDYIQAPTFTGNSGSVTSRAGGPGGQGTPANRAGGAGGATGAIPALANQGRSMVKWIKAASFPVGSSVPTGLGNYPPNATTYKGGII